MYFMVLPYFFIYFIYLLKTSPQTNVWVYNKNNILYYYKVEMDLNKVK